MTYTEDHTQPIEVANGEQKLIRKPRKPRDTDPAPAAPDSLSSRQRALRNEASMRRGELVRQKAEIEKELKEIDEAFGFTEGEEKPVRKAARKAVARKPRAPKSDSAPIDTKAILELLARAGNLGGSLGELADKLEVDKADLAKALKTLVKAGEVSTEGRNRGLRYIIAAE